jgi:hypothetical protein
MRPRLLHALIAAAMLIPVAAAGAGTFAASSPERVAANSVTFQDSTGEDPAAPDITTIVVSNDDAGILSFRVNVPNRPQFGQDIYVVLFVDTDSNSATGDPDLAGVDYVIELARSEVNLFRWDGESFSRRFGDPSAVTLSYAYSGGITVRISAAELGNTKKFNFIVEFDSGIAVDPVTGELDFTNAKGDVAPGGGVGLYPFEVKTAAARLVVQRLTTTPTRPVAGKLFSAKLRVTRSDTGAALKSGQVTCVGRVGRAALRAKTRRFVGSLAVCAWAIPATAKGKTFRGSVAVVFEGKRAVKAVSATIR